MKIFINNTQKIAQHNEDFKTGYVTFTMAMNEFGDMTPEEFEKIYLMKPTNSDEIRVSEVETFPQTESYMPENFFSIHGKVPKAKNWIKEGAVTGVKYQGPCRSCWAFATVGAVESNYFIHGPNNTKLQSLSVQQLLDCMRKEYETEGCSKGSPQKALQYIIKNGGIESDRTYRYIAKVDTCKYKPENKIAQVKSFKKLEQGNEKELKQIVGLKGPVICRFHLEDDFYQFYSSGIYSHSACKTVPLNHAMVIVGYGTENGKDYWILKNSWSTTWGDRGYVKLRRNENMCGIANSCFYPII